MTTYVLAVLFADIPENIRFSPQKDEYEVGETITCSATSFPPATAFMWTRSVNGVPTQLASTPAITVAREWEDQEQTLRCRVTNAVGDGNGQLVFTARGE